MLLQPSGACALTAPAVRWCVSWRFQVVLAPVLIPTGFFANYSLCRAKLQIHYVDVPCHSQPVLASSARIQIAVQMDNHSS